MNMPKPTSDLRTLGLAFKAGKIVYGEKAVLYEIKKIKLIILTRDAGENITKKIHDKCQFYKIPLRHDVTKAEIFEALGKAVTVIGITDQGFRDLLL